MKIQVKRDNEYIEVRNATIEINGNRYRLSETIDGRLTVNKISLDGTDDYMRVHPKSGNEIDIS
jgi:hypothetical protein